MKRLADAYIALLKMLIALCLAVMCVLVFGNVVLRYGFNSGITVSEELSRMCFVWLTFLGAIVVLREHGHLGVDMLVRRMPEIGRRVCLAISHLIMLWMCWLMIQGSWVQTIINLHVTAPATELSMGLIYGIGVVFGVSAAAFLLHDLWLIVSGKLHGDALIMVQDSEDHVETTQKASAAPPKAASASALTGGAK